MFCVILRTLLLLCFFFFFNDTATTEIYTLSLHDALPISFPTAQRWHRDGWRHRARFPHRIESDAGPPGGVRSEEHTSELQSRLHLVCRLLLEKKNIQHALLAPLLNTVQSQL